MKRPIERRIHDGQIEVRQLGDKIGLRGYAAVFDSPAYGEVIKRSAFDKTLAERDNVRLLVNHDGVPLASTNAGTMTLQSDERGLLVDVPSLDMNNPTVQELVSAMNRGDIDQMSFAFAAVQDPKIDGVRNVTEAKLYDVSVVTYPWYDATSAELMSAGELELCLRSMPQEIRDTIIINVSGEVTLEGSTVTDASVDSGTDTTTETEVETPDPAAIGLASHSTAEARALLGLPPLAA